jgi:endonuclease YncB( thermonuclease family)
VRHGWLCSLALCLGGSALAQLPVQATRHAWVSWVVDGDTVLLLPQGEHEALKWRIEGIDAPESCQPGGEAARDALIDLTLRKVVDIQTQGQDVYGRQVGRLWVDGQDVGAELVRSGMAWAWSHRTGRGPYAAQQREAQHARRGLFAAGQSAMSPAVFRQFHGSCHEAQEGLAPVQRTAPQTGQAGSR